MRKILLLILLLTSSAFGDNEDKRNKVLRIIDSEIVEVNRVLKATKGSKPDFILRLSELFYEKAKLIREREINNYMKIPEAERRTVNKELYHKESKVFLENAQKTAKFLVNKYPNFKDKAGAYFILAKNAMELKDKKNAEKYFKIAHNSSSGNTELQEATGISIAENLYNDHKYAQAVPYYEKALINKTDKWWTKDAFNLAFCYHKSKQNFKAINLLREIHRLSKSGNYIDKSAEVEYQITLLYILEGRLGEGETFFREQKVDIPPTFLAAAKWFEKTGKVLQAEQLLDRTLNLNPTDQQEAEIYSTLLNIYEKYGRVEKHLNACKKLAEFSKKGKISSETLETLVFQAERVGNTMQKQVASIAYKHSPETRKRKALIAVEYYNLLLEIDPKNNDKWYFYAAESLYGAGLYSQAIPYYYNGNKAAKDKNNKEFINLTTVGLLASLDKPSVAESLKEQYTMTAYRLSLENDSKSEKASKIYQRIFKYYISKKMMADAEKTLMEFNENFPNESGIIEAMIAQIIDYYKRVKNYPEVERWAKRVASGEFKVSSNYTGQVRLTFVSTKLEKVEKATNKTEAINGYSEIYSNQVASRDARANAAYNISIIYFEMEDPDTTYQWIEKTLSLMDLNAKRKYASSLQAMGKDFLGRRQFDRALNIYEKILDATCATKASLNEDIFGEMAYIEISEKNYSNAFNRMEKYKGCGISQNTFNSLKADLLDDLIRAEQIGRFNEYFRAYQNDISMISILIKSLGDLMAFYINEGLLDKADEIKMDIYRLYGRGKKAKHNFSSDARDVYAGLELETLKREINRMNAITLAFPESVFQKSFQEKYNLMVSINKIFSKITSLGSNQANVAAFRYMVSAYRSFINSVNQVKPTGDQNYINSFRKTMGGVTGPYANQAAGLESRARSIIETGDILSKDNFFFINTPHIVGDYEYVKSGVLMDKGGGR